MKSKLRVVVDSNVLISRLLVPASAPGRAVRRVVDEAQLLMSDATFSELVRVLARPKFDSYLSVAARQEFIRLVGRVAERVAIVYAVRACRDPRDDMFLELAVNGSADRIVTGDADLLSIENYQGVRIISPAQYLSE